MKRGKGCSSVPPISQPYPWLMFSHGKSSRIQTFYSIPENRYYMRKLPYLSGKIVCASCEGWLVILDHKDDQEKSDEHIFLINPISMQKIALPPSPSFRNLGDQLCVLSTPPTEPNCILAFFMEDEQPSVIFWRPGQENWIEQVYGHQVITQAKATSNGKIFGLVHFSDLAVVGIDDDDGGGGGGGRLVVTNLGAAPAPEKSRPGIVHSRSYLVGSESGEIFIVQFAMRGESLRRIEDIEVFRFNDDSLDWTKVDNIGDRALFLGTSNCTSCSASQSNLKPNVIYFVEKGERSLFVFDIKEKRITASLPCPNVVHNLSGVHWVYLLA